MAELKFQAALKNCLCRQPSSHQFWTVQIESGFFLGGICATDSTSVQHNESNCHRYRSTRRGGGYEDLQKKSGNQHVRRPVSIFSVHLDTLCNLSSAHNVDFAHRTCWYIRRVRFACASWPSEPKGLTSPLSKLGARWRHFAGGQPHAQIEHSQSVTVPRTTVSIKAKCETKMCAGIESFSDKHLARKDCNTNHKPRLKFEG